MIRRILAQWMYALCLVIVCAFGSTSFAQTVQCQNGRCTVVQGQSFGYVPFPPPGTIQSVSYAANPTSGNVAYSNVAYAPAQRKGLIGRIQERRANRSGCGCGCR
jgi:hypothetical protein